MLVGFSFPPIEKLQNQQAALLEPGSPFNGYTPASPMSPMSPLSYEDDIEDNLEAGTEETGSSLELSTGF